jgi:hypothetical protein
MREKVANFYRHIKHEQSLQQLYSAKIADANPDHQYADQPMLEDENMVNDDEEYSHHSQ